MDDTTLTYLRQLWDDLMAGDVVPEGIGPSEMLLIQHHGNRVAVYVNVAPSDAQRGGSVQTVVEARRQQVQGMLDRVNRIRKTPLEVVATYVDTEHLNTRLTIRPEGRRLVDETGHGKFDLIMLSTVEEIGTKESDLDEFQSSISPVMHLAVDVIDTINARLSQ